MKHAILVLAGCFLFTVLHAQTSIMDCTIESGGGSSDLYVYLTDTLLVTGFAVKIGTKPDGSDLFNQQYSKATLPQNASLDFNTLILPLGVLPSGEKYTWVKVSLSTGSYYEIKVSTSN